MKRKQYRNGFFRGGGCAVVFCIVPKEGKFWKIPIGFCVFVVAWFQ